MINPLYLICLFTWCLYLLPTCSIACTCVYSHPQEHFCSSDFVVTLSVQGDPKQLTNHPNGQLGYLRYPVKVNKIFKGIDITSVRKGFIYTGSPLSSCSPTFNKNITYLMTGRLVNGKPFVSSCNFISEWANLTNRQKKGFRWHFARACSCKVIDTESYPFYDHHDSDNDPSNGQNVETKRRSGYCHWETKWEIEFDCQGFYSTCTPLSTIQDKNSPLRSPFHNNLESNDVAILFGTNRRRNGSKLGQKCQWDPNVDYEKCMKRKSKQQ